MSRCSSSSFFKDGCKINLPPTLCDGTTARKVEVRGSEGLLGVAWRGRGAGERGAGGCVSAHKPGVSAHSPSEEGEEHEYGSLEES